MNRIRQITDQAVFRQYMDRIKELERERIYCSHDVEHSLAVARLIWIRVLEEKLPLDKEVVYGAALLHDLGRVEQYTGGKDHCGASVALAARILEKTDFSPEEQAMICYAVGAHREGVPARPLPDYLAATLSPETEASARLLAECMYRADKESRMCFLCRAQATCNWPEEQRNMFVKD